MKCHSCAMTSADNAGVEAPGQQQYTEAMVVAVGSLSNLAQVLTCKMNVEATTAKMLLHIIFSQWTLLHTIKCSIRTTGPAAGRSHRGDRNCIPTPLIPVGPGQGRGARERQAEDR